MSRGRVDPQQHGFDDAVLAALNTLGETARACLLLRTILDLSYRELAETLEIPEGTAMSHVHRARAAMRKALDPANSSARGGAAREQTA